MGISVDKTLKLLPGIVDTVELIPEKEERP